MILNPCFAALDTLVTSFNKGKSLCWRTAQKSLPERQPHARVLDLVLSQPEKTQASHKPSTPGAQRQLLSTSQLQRDDRGNSPPCQGGGGRKKKKTSSGSDPDFVFLACWILLPAHPRQAARPRRVLSSGKQLGNVWSRAGFMYQHVLGGCQLLAASFFCPL